ncbi:MAG: hypothetical protein RXR31_04600 [Thermoproteota archaeon]|jgi:hypothetical protein
MNKFLLELEELYLKNSEQLEDPYKDIFRQLIDKAIQLYLRQLVKSNHTMMELILALHFLKRKKVVDIEKELGDLIADVLVLNNGKYEELIEIETGFVPPEYSADPVSYRFAREVSKVARYCKYSDFFSLACPPFHLLQVPEIFLKAPKERDEAELKEIKKILDVYYKALPIEIDDLRNAKIDYIYIINVDNLKVKRLTLNEYFDLTLNLRKAIF